MIIGSFSESVRDIDAVGAGQSIDSCLSGDEWFCVRTHPKREHLAAAQLRQDSDIAVFLPRIRFRRPTRQGPVWTTEALFPNYLFARFDLAMCLRRVRHARGVREVVHFGEKWPTVPASTIRELQRLMGAEELRVIPADFSPGDLVQISGGPFHGLEAVVSRVMPGQQRIAVLLEFLGSMTTVEVDAGQLVFETEPVLKGIQVTSDLVYSSAAVA